MIAATKEAASAFVEDMGHIRKVVAEQGKSSGELRRLSGVLRRLLVERDLAEVAAPRIGRLSLRAPDNNPVYKFAQRTPLLFFASGRARIFNSDHTTIIARDATNYPLVVPPIHLVFPPDFDVTRRVDLRLDNFLAQRVLCLRGDWVSRRSVIKYIAHIASGVHSGEPREPDEAILAHLRRSTHIRIKDDKSLHLALLDDGLESQETAFKALAPDSIDPVLIELLATAKFVAESPDVIRLEELVRAELRLPSGNYGDSLPSPIAPASLPRESGK